MKRTIMIAALLLSSVAHAQTYKDVWNDVRKPWRPDSEMGYDVQIDGAACDRQVGEQRGYPSARYRQCMAARHWKFSHLERLPDAVEPDHYDPIPDTFPTPSDPPLPEISAPEVPVEASPAPDIHPFCADTIC